MLPLHKKKAKQINTSHAVACLQSTHVEKYTKLTSQFGSRTAQVQQSSSTAVTAGCAAWHSLSRASPLLSQQAAHADNILKGTSWGEKKPRWLQNVSLSCVACPPSFGRCQVCVPVPCPIGHRITQYTSLRDTLHAVCTRSQKRSGHLRMDTVAQSDTSHTPAPLPGLCRGCVCHWGSTFCANCPT